MHFTNPTICTREYGCRILAYASAVKNTVRFLVAPLGPAWFCDLQCSPMKVVEINCQNANLDYENQLLLTTLQ